MSVLMKYPLKRFAWQKKKKKIHPYLYFKNEFSVCVLHVAIGCLVPKECKATAELGYVPLINQLKKNLKAVNSVSM